MPKMADSNITEAGLSLKFLDLGSDRKKALKQYYYLCKPGIVYSNVMTGAAGYLFASRWHVNFTVFICALFGMASSIAAACILNNYIDRGIDAKMARTKKRALATGSIPVANAIGLAVILGMLGVLLLLQTNLLTVGLGILSVILYVGVYGYFKRHSVHGTLVGTLPGAASLVAGYTAFIGRLDLTALLLLLVMVTWQMAHFYAIAIYRLEDYIEAGIPVWPAVRGILSTKRLIIAYMAGFFVCTVLLGVLGQAGYLFSVIMGCVALYWLIAAVRSYSSVKDNMWARRLFFYSLVVLMAMSVLLPLSTLFT
jgi:heme o synthase